MNLNDAINASTPRDARATLIFNLMMARMIDRDDATYEVDEMIAGDMPCDDLDGVNLELLTRAKG